MPEGDVLEACEGGAANDARQPADPLRDDRVPLVRHRGRPLLAAAERLLDLSDLGSREMTDLEREPLQRRGQQRQRVQHLGVPVALEDLRRARCRLEAEPLAGDALDLGIGGGVGADGAGKLADADPLEGARDTDAVPLERERPAGELEAERRRFGVDAVCPADRDRAAMLLGPRGDGRERPLDSFQDQRTRVAELQRQRGVEHIGRGQPVVEPAAFLAQLLGDGIDEGGDVVLRSGLELGDPLRRRDGRAGPDRLDGGARHGAEFGPPVERRQLDFEPAREPRLVRPDRRHGRAGVARDHAVDLSVSSGAPPAAGRPRKGRCPPGSGRR